ncbi:Uncharacterised protein [Serratia grimesii]|jgi:hypothetical protein|nr:Uncharacterised protein [Serratia grimesii]CAI1636950.1 Uncharacterised protein [Serratia entomophila]
MIIKSSCLDAVVIVALLVICVIVLGWGFYG